MRLSEYASTQRTYGSRKVPRSVQQSIPIDRIYEDGTWRCGNVYSQMWSMPDINFTMSDEDNKAKILNLLGKVYMGVPSDCWLKICIVSQRMDEKSFRENVLLHRNLDGLDKWRVERNRRIRQCVQDAGNVVQHKYLILSTNKQNVTDRDLNKSNLRRAKQLALMLDVFANGSLQAFSHTTNVDMNNRLICFNIQSLGDQLRPIAMMSLLEFINMQVMTNRRKDATAATWIYFDEIHVLLKDPMSSNFLYSSWKRFRKYNAYATGISQDIQDYLDNPVAYALLSNSEFVIMLRQSKSLEALERLYGLSKPQLEFLRNASEGHGIIKMGNSMIPFSNLEPKDTAVYKLITTKPGEATAEK